MKKTGKKIGAFVLALMLAASVSIVPLATADEEEDTSYFDDLLDEVDDTAQTEEDDTIVEDSAAIAGAQKAGTLLTLENTRIRFHMDKATGKLYVMDKTSDKLWTSNPYDAKADELASGVTRTNLQAQLVVSYIENNNLSSVNNLVGSINRDSAAYTVTGNTIRVDYAFPEEGFSVPMEYQLTETGFQARVLFDEIQDTPERRVNTVEVLPYFGAAGLKEEGYMLIPDGSGALIRFNNKKEEFFPYEKAFYGGDKGQTENTKTSKNEDIRLPVYGIKTGNSAFAATVTSGAECGSLYACVSGKLCNYNRVYTKATYRTYRTVNLEDAVGKAVYAKYAAINAVELSHYEVTYTMLSGDQAGYVGMAQGVRQILTAHGLKKTETGAPALFVDFYGATEKEKAFLGIRYTGVQKLTTFRQAQEILEDLKEQGVAHINVGYRNFSASDYQNKIASNVTPSSKLGGKNGYRNLLQYAAENDIAVYPYADFTAFRKNGNSYYSFSDVVMGLELSVIKQYRYSIADGQPNENGLPRYLVAAHKLGDAKTQLLKTLKKYASTGVLLEESAQRLYNDFSPKGYLIDRTKSAQEDIYQALTEDGQTMMLSNPNAYAMIYATALTDMPMNSSRYFLFDEEVPFLQLVLKGTVPYSSAALNIEGVSDRTLLKLIETGTNPKFAVIAEPGKRLLDTNLDHLYGATYTDCADTIQTYYQALADVAEKVGDAAICGHEKQNDLVTVRYDNGVTIYLNYADREQKAPGGAAVPAGGYRIG